MVDLDDLSLHCVVEMVKERESIPRVFEVSLAQQQGCEQIIGIDEAGRGPLCGPVVCAALSISRGCKVVDNIVDSKMLNNEATREHVYEELIACKDVKWSVAVISNETIDEINILQATLLGMRTSCENLMQANNELFPEPAKCVALIDGNKVPAEMPCPATSIVKGDSKSTSIAAASIIAKVTRDRIMHSLAQRYPGYDLEIHKGYPTPKHRQLLYEKGPLPIHRFSYSPVKVAQERQRQKNERGIDLFGASVEEKSQQKLSAQQEKRLQTPMRQKRSRTSLFLEEAPPQMRTRAEKKSKSINDTHSPTLRSTA